MRASKFQLLIPVLALAVIALAGCYQQKLDKENSVGLSKDPYPKAPHNLARELHILIWPDTITQELLDDFEARYGVKVITTEFEEDQDAYNLLETTPDGWDVIMISQYMSNRMRHEGKLQEVPRINSYIYNYIDTTVVNKDADPQMKFFVPYDYATLGIAFNINLLAGFPRDWNYLTENLDNPLLYGRLIVPDDMRYTLAAAMLYNGVDPSKATLKDLEDAKKMLIANVTKLGLRFVTFGKIYDELNSQNAILAVTWSGSAAEVLRDKQECRFLLPEGKTIITVDGFSIPKESKAPETAALFIEYMLQPYSSLIVANKCLYASVNTRTMKYVDRFIINGPSCFLPSPDEIVHMKHLTPEEQKMYEEAWAEIKSTPMDQNKVRLIPVN